jgi:NADH-quinone oxidoreductase subunit M
LTTFLFPICILASWQINKNIITYFCLLLGIEALLLSAFSTLNLLYFFFTFEAILVPMFL